MKDNKTNKKIKEDTNRRRSGRYYWGGRMRGKYDQGRLHDIP